MSIHSLRLSGGCVGFCPVVLSISSVTEKQGWIFIKFMDRFDFGAGNDWLNCGGDLDQELILREKSCYVVSADLSCEVTLTEICIVFNFSQYCHIAKIRVTAADTLNLWYSSRDNNVQMWLLCGLEMRPNCCELFIYSTSEKRWLFIHKFTDWMWRSRRTEAIFLKRMFENLHWPVLLTPTDPRAANFHWNGAWLVLQLQCQLPRHYPLPYKI